MFNDNFKQIAELNFSLIVDSISSIGYVDEEGEKQSVTDRTHITEFLDNAENVVGKKIEEQITKLNNVGINHEMKLQCEKCTNDDGTPVVFESRVNFDPVNFFTAS